VSPANNIIGLLPAAGEARRLGRLPCSKEIFPVAPALETPTSQGLKSAVEFALDAFREASIDTAYIILRPGKWDIPNYLEDGTIRGVNTAYLVAPNSIGTPFTIDAAHPFVRDATVTLGFPDIVFGSSDVYVRLLNRLDQTGSDVVLGLFRARDPSKADMVSTDASGNVREIVIKPDSTTLRNTWICAAWRPSFTAFHHEYLGRPAVIQAAQESELFVGNVIQAAIRAGLAVTSERISDGAYVDIGTPEALAEAVREQWSKPLPQSG